MHVQCCDITYDITAPFNDVTSANKMMCFGHGTSKVCPSQNCPKWPYRQEHHSNGTPRVLGVPCNATYISIYPASVQEVWMYEVVGVWHGRWVHFVLVFHGFGQARVVCDKNNSSL